MLKQGPTHRVGGINGAIATDGLFERDRLDRSRDLHGRAYVLSFSLIFLRQFFPTYRAPDVVSSRRSSSPPRSDLVVLARRQHSCGPRHGCRWSAVPWTWLQSFHEGVRRMLDLTVRSQSLSRAIPCLNRQLLPRVEFTHNALISRAAFVCGFRVFCRSADCSKDFRPRPLRTRVVLHRNPGAAFLWPGSRVNALQSRIRMPAVLRLSQSTGAPSRCHRT